MKRQSDKELVLKMLNEETYEDLCDQLEYLAEIQDYEHERIAIKAFLELAKEEHFRLKGLER